MANKKDIENLIRLIKERDDLIAQLKLDALEFAQSWKSLSESYLKAENDLKAKNEAYNKTIDAISAMVKLAKDQDPTEIVKFLIEWDKDFDALKKDAPKPTLEKMPEDGLIPQHSIWTGEPFDKSKPSDDKKVK